MTDRDLLQRHLKLDAHAFTELVGRHIGWIHALARRRLGDADRADDATQAVFIVLARAAPKLRPGVSLGPWLFGVACRACSESNRAQSRRRRHETQAALLHNDDPTADTPEPEWRQLAPLLDELVSKLRQADREAIILRFHQRMSFAEVGTAIGVSEEAARKRVERAIEKLRSMAERPHVNLNAAGLGSMLWTNVAEAAGAPADLLAQTATNSLGAASVGMATGTSAALAKGVLTMMAMQQTKRVAILALAAVCVGGAATAVVSALQAPAHEAPPPATTRAVRQIFRPTTNGSGNTSWSSPIDAPSRDGGTTSMVLITAYRGDTWPVRRQAQDSDPAFRGRIIDGDETEVRLEIDDGNDGRALTLPLDQPRTLEVAGMTYTLQYGTSVVAGTEDHYVDHATISVVFKSATP